MGHIYLWSYSWSISSVKLSSVGYFSFPPTLLSALWSCRDEYCVNSAIVILCKPVVEIYIRTITVYLLQQLSTMTNTTYPKCFLSLAITFWFPSHTVHTTVWNTLYSATISWTDPFIIHTWSRNTDVPLASLLLLRTKMDCLMELGRILCLGVLWTESDVTRWTEMYISTSVFLKIVKNILVVVFDYSFLWHLNFIFGFYLVEIYFWTNSHLLSSWSFWRHFLFVFLRSLPPRGPPSGCIYKQSVFLSHQWPSADPMYIHKHRKSAKFIHTISIVRMLSFP